VTSHLLPTYARVDLAFERGEGAWLTATNGERYLDFTGGVAVNALGHAHPRLIEAIVAQAQKVWHVSNLFPHSRRREARERLCEASFADFVFFNNSGAEANELGIKITRKYHWANGQPERFRIITFEGAFHGRSLATLAATGAPKYLEVSSGGRRLRPGRARRHRGGETHHRTQHRRDPDRADPGGRRRAVSAARVPARVARPV